MALATIEITVADTATLKEIARVLEASELIYNRIHIILSRRERHITDLQRRLHGPISVPADAGLRLRHVRPGSLLLGFEGFFNELTFLGAFLGLVMLVAKIRKTWAEGTKAQAEARKADANARKVDAEARRIETERRKMMLEIEEAIKRGKAKTLVSILMKAEGKLSRLQLAIDTDLLHHTLNEYLNKDQQLMDALRELAGPRVPGCRWSTAWPNR